MAHRMTSREPSPLEERSGTLLAHAGDVGQKRSSDAPRARWRYRPRTLSKRPVLLISQMGDDAFVARRSLGFSDKNLILTGNRARSLR
jgi:hypothetical protein